MYRIIHTIHRYDTIYTIHTYVSNNSQALIIRPYDTKLFVHDTIRIVQYILRTILTTMIIVRVLSIDLVITYCLFPKF